MQEKIKERTNIGPILIGPFLLNLCHSIPDKRFFIFIWRKLEIRQKQYVVVFAKSIFTLIMKISCSENNER